jgi:nucleoside-diphosphate-sugar epimerase
MSLHVVVGSGPVGTATAHHLVAAGHTVRVVTRSGTGPAHPAIERVAADAVDPGRLAEVATGAAALYNCASPPYHQWPKLWPPLAASLLSAAERSGAVLVTMGNLYGYGPVERPMTEDLPLAPTSVKGSIRARMCHDALAAHQAGRVRATEARASDFVGDGGRSLFTTMVAPAVRAGRPALVPADLDAPHSFSYPGDAGRTLAALGTDERAWGRVWHVPTPPPTTIRRLADRYAEIIGAPRPRLRRMPAAMLRLGGLFSTEAREFIEMRYQFERPFIVDSTAAETMFGLTATSLDEALATVGPPVQSKSTAE